MYAHLKVARSLWPYSHKDMIRKRASPKIKYDTVMITASGRELDPFPITGKVPIPAVTESSGSPEFSVTARRVCELSTNKASLRHLPVAQDLCSARDISASRFGEGVMKKSEPSRKVEWT